MITWCTPMTLVASTRRQSSAVVSAKRFSGAIAAACRTQVDLAEVAPQLVGDAAAVVLVADVGDDRRTAADLA